MFKYVLHRFFKNKNTPAPSENAIAKQTLIYLFCKKRISTITIIVARYRNLRALFLPIYASFFLSQKLKISILNFCNKLIFNEYITYLPCLLQVTNSAFFKMSKCLEIDGFETGSLTVTSIIKSINPACKLLFLLLSITKKILPESMCHLLLN